ncbi:hypothetical protein B1R32_10613 [Abditibacterium utsteinense]|uniref:High-affinity nickel-transport protein n=2 Tax=Abditibacterium utsteinense TaxID=1960156 RepID=A0A2S8STU7_9BACT|nr:hypothetical protein B1R32_10613 [Abditibacterium utsteinense]
MAAVSTFVASRPKPREAAMFGVRWAVGHGLSLFVIGSILFVFKHAAQTSQPELFASGVLDRFVGLVLVALGIWTLFQVASSRASKQHEHGHFHDGHFHSHGGESNSSSVEAHRNGNDADSTKNEGHFDTHGEKGHSHSHSGGLASLGMGVLHGAAGTGAFIGQSVVSLSSSYAFVFLYTLLFSLGVLLSMAVYAGALGGLLTSFERRGALALSGARVVTGVLTCAIGFCLVSGIELPGFFDHLVH